MDETEVLIVGPADKKTGGVARYIAEHRRQLPEHVQTRTYDIAVPSGSGVSHYVRGGLQSIVDMLGFCVESRPSVVHVHSSHYFSFYQSAFYVLFAAFVWRCPVVIHIHGSSFDTFVQEASAPIRWIQSVVFDACSAVIVLSEYWVEVVKDVAPADRLEILPNAIDADEYATDPGGNPPHLVFISNHVERKGIAELAEAIDQLERRLDGEFRVTIAGTGPLSHHAERLAHEYPNVTYEGYVSEERKRALLAEASIYVLPTYAEGLPIGLLEGMAAGNAVVSTSVASIPNVVDSEHGTIVEPGNVDMLADALEELIVAPETVEAMGEKSREGVESQYTWGVVSEKLERLYGRLTSN